MVCPGPVAVQEHRHAGYSSQHIDLRSFEGSGRLVGIRVEEDNNLLAIADEVAEPDVHQACVQVDVSPLQPAQFAAPGAGYE